MSMRTRALSRLSGARGTGRYGQRFSAERESALLAWAATLSDETILGWRNTGLGTLRWIRDHQVDDGWQERGNPDEDDFTIASVTTPDGIAYFPESTFASVLKRLGWRVELFWNSAGGWFTARLISPWDRDGAATYPGGFLAPFDNPIGASGATPEQALANLSEAVLEWA